MAEVKSPVLFLAREADNPFRRTDGHLGYELMCLAGLSAAIVEIPGGKHGLWKVAEEARSPFCSGYSR